MAKPITMAVTAPGPGVGVVLQVEAARRHSWLLVTAKTQAPHAEDEQVDRVGQQRQAHDDLLRCAGSSSQTPGREHADAGLAITISALLLHAIVAVGHHGP